jgi:hypothetical protein
MHPAICAAAGSCSSTAACKRPRTSGTQQKLSVHVPLGQAVDCLLVSSVKPAPQV